MRKVPAFSILALAFSVVTAVAQEQSESDLAKQSQNPVGNLVSLPFQNNTSFGIGPNDSISNVLNIQPVYPVGLSKNWNLINRGIVPVIYQEALFPEVGDSLSGLGDISYTGFISPSQPGKIIWGVGPSFLFPSATEDRWASDKWSGGAGVVVLTMPGSWVLGVLVSNVWSFTGDDDAESVNLMTLQPIINYNLKKGWYLTSVPVIVANWSAPSDNRWTVPLGGGFGRILKWGRQPLDLSMQAFYNVEKPKPRIADAPNLQNQGETWTLRLQLKLLFPK